MESLKVACGDPGFLGRSFDTIGLDHRLVQYQVDGRATPGKNYDHITGHTNPAVSL